MKFARKRREAQASRLFRFLGAALQIAKIHKFRVFSCNEGLKNGRKALKLFWKEREMSDERQKLANLNLKITEDERWDFKEFCVRNRMSQVDGFRLAYKLMKEHFEDKTE